VQDVNIFEKDYLFVPIHDKVHWSLVIICHPNLLARQLQQQRGNQQQQQQQEAELTQQQAAAKHRRRKKPPREDQQQQQQQQEHEEPERGNAVQRATKAALGAAGALMGAAVAAFLPSVSPGKGKQKAAAAAGADVSREDEVARINAATAEAAAAFAAQRAAEEGRELAPAAAAAAAAAAGGSPDEDVILSTEEYEDCCETAAPSPAAATAAAAVDDMPAAAASTGVVPQPCILSLDSMTGARGAVHAVAYMFLSSKNQRESDWLCASCIVHLSTDFILLPLTVPMIACQCPPPCVFFSRPCLWPCVQHAASPRYM
jgi:Ulp1 family protease